MDQYQKDILFFLIHSSEKQTINSISKQINCSVPTTTKIIRDMLKSGLVIPHECDDSHRGRRPTLYSVSPDAYFFVGVDIRRYSINMGIMNLTGNLVCKEARMDFVFENTPECLDTLCRLIEEFLQNNSFPKEKVNLMNVNISGRVDMDKGYSHSIFHFEGHDMPLAESLTQQLGIRTIICNDTQAMTYGELVFGEGRQFSNFLFLNAGWGVGLGIVIDGKLYTGKNGYAGELGHMNVYDNELMCHCGKRGCLETESSGLAMIRMLREKVNDGAVTVLSEDLKKGNKVTANDIVKAANNEDPLSLDIIEKVGLELGRQIANMINIFNPEAVIVGGSLSLANEYLLGPIRQGIRKYSLKLINKEAVLLRSQNCDEVGVLGACALARERLFKEIMNQ